MKRLKIIFVGHLILGPFAIWIIANDAKHPEWWGDWWRNPTYSIPWCVMCDCIIWGLALDMWRRERRMTQGLDLLAKANRLLAEGKTEAADAAYERGKSMCGLK